MAEIVHDAAPSIRVIEAIEATGFGDAIDVLVPKLNHLNLWLPYFQKARAGEGTLVLHVLPSARPLSQPVSRPATGQGRELHWISYKYGLDGYLHWGLNYFAEGVDPYSEEGISKDLPLGDRAIMYPGRDGPLGSLRWSAMRDGLQDYEYLWVLEDRQQVAQGAARRCQCRLAGATPAFAGAVPPRGPLVLRLTPAGPTRCWRPGMMLAIEIEALAQHPLLYVQTEPCEGTVIPTAASHQRARRDRAGRGGEGQRDPRQGGRGRRHVPGGPFPPGPTVTIETTKDGPTRKVTRTFRLVD